MMATQELMHVLHVLLIVAAMAVLLRVATTEVSGQRTATTFGVGAATDGQTHWYDSEGNDKQH